MSKKEKCICIKVTSEEKAHIKELASAEYMPVSKFIFMCIDEHTGKIKGDEKE